MMVVGLFHKVFGNIISQVWSVPNTSHLSLAVIRNTNIAMEFCAQLDPPIGAISSDVLMMCEQSTFFTFQGG